ncbi:hypothetical protein ACQP2E_01545 [Actinoplanes sp. CA-015351]|uniref:hypothetical protein n=1 Tax=Actinoplanes sp. CA-015351 TaxID=3239897 RepID=UPI003D9586D9
MSTLRAAILAVLCGLLMIGVPAWLPLSGPQAGTAGAAAAVGAVVPARSAVSAPGAVLHGVATIAPASLADDTAGVVYILGGRELGRAAGAPWALTLDTRSVFGSVSGDFRLKLAVIDRLGGVTYRYPSYRVDNAGPVIDTTGIPARVAAGRTELSVRVGDLSRTARIEWWVGGVPSGTGERITADLHGNTQVTVKAWDRVGNTTAVTSLVITKRS